MSDTIGLEHPVFAFASVVIGCLSISRYYTRTCQLRVFCRDSEANTNLINKCKSLSEYRPTPFYLLDYHGHVPTIAFSLIRQLFSKPLPIQRELFKLSDGGTVGILYIINAVVAFTFLH